jgi:hypothetical protein
VSALGGLLAVAAVLLVAGGTAKMVRPRPTANALHVPPVLVRIGAVSEAFVGAAALTTGARVAAAFVALSYLSFASFVGWALARNVPLATCACFGEPDTPPTLLHVIVNLALAAAASGAALTSAGRSATTLGPAALVGVAVVAYLTFLILTALPRLRAEPR